MTKLVALIVLLFVIAPACRAQEANVYLVKMFQCIYEPHERSQTGFRVRKLKGLVTALHGVADCQRMTVSSKSGPIFKQPLTIRSIDKDHDVALLSSAEFDTAPDDGFELAEPLNLMAHQSVKVVGHPYGISSLDTILTVRDEPLKLLKELVPAVPLSNLITRQSPNHLIQVINLQGNLLPGHSGAPVLDSNGHVLGVANGGLKGGFAGISWAIPYKDIEWDDRGVINKIQDLAKFDPNIEFSNDVLPPAVEADRTAEFCTEIKTLVDESRTGFISLVGNAINNSDPVMFDSTLMLQGADFSYVKPNSYIRYNMLGNFWGRLLLQRKGDAQSYYYQLVSKLIKCVPGWQRKEIVSLDKTNHSRLYLFRERKGGPNHKNRIRRERLLILRKGRHVRWHIRFQ